MNVNPTRHLNRLEGEKPSWLGVELRHREYDKGEGCEWVYVGVCCFDDVGELPSTSDLEKHALFLEELRREWPGDQFHLLTGIEDLKNAARRALVFGAVVDGTSASALALCETLEREFVANSAEGTLRLLELVSLPREPVSSNSAKTLPSTRGSFDLLICSDEVNPWREHHDLAVMFALLTGPRLPCIDFQDIRQMLSRSHLVDDVWVSAHTGSVATKVIVAASGPERAEIAARKAIHAITARLPLSKITGVVFEIAAERVRQREAAAAYDVIRLASPEDARIVWQMDFSGSGDALEIRLVAITTNAKDIFR